MRSSLRPSARAIVRPICATSRLWVRRTRKWSPSGATNTWVLWRSRRKATEWMIRSRSRWKMSRGPRGPSSRSGWSRPRERAGSAATLAASLIRCRVAQSCRSGNWSSGTRRSRRFRGRSAKISASDGTAERADHQPRLLAALRDIARNAVEQGRGDASSAGGTGREAPRRWARWRAEATISSWPSPPHSGSVSGRVWQGHIERAAAPSRPGRVEARCGWIE